MLAKGDDDEKARRFRAAALPHLDDVYTLARYLLRNPADAEDAAQECYLRAFRHFETFRGGAIKPWLLAIVRNVCRAEYARRGALATVQAEDLEAAEQCIEGLWSEAEPTPEASALGRLDGETVRRLIAGLAVPFREAIVLREIEGLSYREIADAIDAPVGTVMSRLSRARAAARCLAGRGERSGAMKCEESAVLLHALLDGELDASHAREVEAHAAGCVRCAAQLAAYSDLRQALKQSALGYSAPASLRNRINNAIPAAAAPVSRRSMLKGFALGSITTAAAAAGVTFVITGQDNASSILGDAVSAHLRSLQADHLIDVQSSNEHTVKPWFNGRIDLAPPVADLTAQGFTLIGGRLDYLDGKPAAVIVYRRRVHVINLFVAQNLGVQLPSAPKLASVQGFNIVRWSEQGLDFLAVSDLNREELEEFVAKFKAATRPQK